MQQSLKIYTSYAKKGYTIGAASMPRRTENVCYHDKWMIFIVSSPYKKINVPGVLKHKLPKKGCFTIKELAYLWSFAGSH